MRYTLLLGAYTGGLEGCYTPCYWTLTIDAIHLVIGRLRKEYKKREKAFIK